MLDKSHTTMSRTYMISDARTANKMSYVYRLAAREEIEITFESKRVL
jgi:hypothetical protein